jgi:hypothetical protein
MASFDDKQKLLITVGVGVAIYFLLKKKKKTKAGEPIFELDKGSFGTETSQGSMQFDTPTSESVLALPVQEQAIVYQQPNSGEAVYYAPEVLPQYAVEQQPVYTEPFIDATLVKNQFPQNPNTNQNYTGVNYVNDFGNQQQIESIGIFPVKYANQNDYAQVSGRKIFGGKKVI